ncbi:MAG: methyltransferase domain-containing protein [Alphaproteobacteria bacterium]|nr:methyltransferase domain-containing protein [Alphaproteobacteria bacterium]
MARDRFTTSIGRAAYGVAQSARVAGYLGQYVLAARLSRPGGPLAARTKPRAEPAPKPGKPGPRRGPGWAATLGDLRALFRRDLRNIEQGYYRVPHDLLSSPGELLLRAPAFFRDVPSVNERRARRDADQVFRSRREAGEGKRYPRYYLQNFHFQSGGYLSDRSARLYDHQVEVLFTGGADAMRRQALVPLYHEIAKRGVRGTRLVDVACGTARFLTFVRDNYPRLDITGIDLSPNYLAEARRNLSPWGGVRLIQGMAEALPLPDDSVDILTNVYLFHELPRKVRAATVREFARVLKPGGALIFVDSIQLGDFPAFDPMLERFPVNYHEPYYHDFITQDLSALFEAAQLTVEWEERAFLSKVILCRKSR